MLYVMYTNIQRHTNGTYYGLCYEGEILPRKIMYVFNAHARTIFLTRIEGEGEAGKLKKRFIVGQNVGTQVFFH